MGRWWIFWTGKPSIYEKKNFNNCLIGTYGKITLKRRHKSSSMVFSFRDFLTGWNYIKYPFSYLSFKRSYHIYSSRKHQWTVTFPFTGTLPGCQGVFFHYDTVVNRKVRWSPGENMSHRGNRWAEFLPGPFTNDQGMTQGEVDVKMLVGAIAERLS